MKRRHLFCALLPAAFLVTGGAVPCTVARAAAADAQRSSLSGVLDLPAGESQPLTVKDPFRPPILPAAVSAEANKAPELPPLLLTAVLQGPRGNVAVVNGVILRTGDVFLDMKVLEITKNHVVFKRGEGKVTLLMQESLYNPLSLGGK